MKTTKLLFYSILPLFLITTNRTNAQDKFQSVIDKYFPSYINEKGYRNSSISEDMIKNIRKQGVWGSPKFDLFMSQIKYTRNASFDIADDDRLKKVGAELIGKIDNAHIYKLYTSSQKNGIGTYIYTLANEHKIIIEVAVISVVQVTHRIGGSSFLGDNINLDAIKTFLGDGK